MFEDLLDLWKNRPRPVLEGFEQLKSTVAKYAFWGAFAAGIVAAAVSRLFGG